MTGTPERFAEGSRPASLLQSARAAVGFMPDDEGLALARVAETLVGTSSLPHLVVEIGAYCGRSTLYLAAGVAAGLGGASGPAAPDAPDSASGSGAGGASTATSSAVVFSVDHHHGSEENQAGWEHHDSSLVDARTGRMDTLPRWRATIDGADAGDLVVGLVGDSPTIAAHWAGAIGLLFIDGGHGSEPAWADYRGWVPHVAPDAFLAIHDVFPDPADGGRPPYELYCQALNAGGFVERADLGRGSLRVLRRRPRGAAPYGNQ